MRRITLITWGLLATVNSYAIAPEQVLGGEEPSASSAPTNAAALPGTPRNDTSNAGAQAPSTPSIPSASNLPELSLKTAKRERYIAITALGGIGFRTYNLSSSALNAFLPGASGYEMGAALEKELSDTGRISGDFQYSSQLYSALSGISPSTFRVIAWQASAQYQILLSGNTQVPSSSAWWLSLGYQLKKRTGIAGSPSSPMTEQLYHGPRLGFVYQGPKRWGNFGYDFTTHVMVPWFFQEGIQTTGSFKYAVSTENALLFRYELRDTATFFLGVKLQADYRSFFGTGSRGAVNANEFEWNLSFPAAFQIRF
jgi:hypothetical protein